MTTPIKLVVGAILLMVLTPVVVELVHALLVPFVMVVAALLIARLIWFRTRL